jgi:hypothetical protein
MGEIGKHLFYLKLENEVRVTYPPEKWGGDPHKVFIIDNLWLGNPLDPYSDAGLRARFLWFNSNPIDSVEVLLKDKNFSNLYFMSCSSVTPDASYTPR